MVYGQEREMAALVRIADHMSLEEILGRMRMIPGLLEFQKWLSIYNAIVDPRPTSEIAMHTGLSEATIHKAIADYNLLGPQAFKAISMSISETGREKHCDLTIM
jgi:hypothetical protein